LDALVATEHDHLHYWDESDKDENPGMNSSGRIARVGIFIMLLVGGCATSGRDYGRAQPDSLILGQTTTAEAIAKYGQPTARSMQSGSAPATRGSAAGTPRPAGLQPAPVAGDIVSLRYSFAQASRPGLLVGPAVAQVRVLALSFWNDKLIAYVFASSFDDDTTNFDEGKAASFVRGQTTRAEIIRQLGRPSGEGIYPHVANQGTRMITYLYVSNDSAGPSIIGQRRVVSVKQFQYLFDASDRLIEIYGTTSSNQTSTPLS
jgi:hypothetical protein